MFQEHNLNDENRIIDIEGKNLDIFLTKTDYQVVLHFDLAVNISVECIITDLQKTHLLCLPPKSDIKKLLSATVKSVKARLEVTQLAILFFVINA